ncbi:MAG: hypothetical protein AAF546_10810 [Verrucomicrobiota bacterium]
MKSPLLTLRLSPLKILDAIENRQEVILTKQGKPLARILPLQGVSTGSVHSQPAFGSAIRVIPGECHSFVPFGSFRVPFGSFRILRYKRLVF